MGYAIGGLSAIVVVLAIDAAAALVGSGMVQRWSIAGLVITASAAVGAAVLLLFSTWLEIGVAALLLLAAAANLSSRRVR